MKDRLIKELEDLRAKKKKAEADLIGLSTAKEKCMSIVNGQIGAIAVVEKLLKELNEPEKK